MWEAVGHLAALPRTGVHGNLIAVWVAFLYAER